MESFSRLPNELILSVVTFAHENRDLLSLCRTSRWIHEIAQRELYREILINNADTAYLLTRSFIENPTLRTYVHHATIDMSIGRFLVNSFFFHYVDWTNEPFDETRLSETDRVPLALAKVLCTKRRPGRDICTILALLLLFLDKAKHITYKCSIRQVDQDIHPLTRLLAVVMSFRSSKAFFSACHTLHLCGRFVDSEAHSVFGTSFHPLGPLLASPATVRLFVENDTDPWQMLDETACPNLALEYIQLKSSISRSSGLCKLLKRCPELQSLKASFKYNRVISTNGHLGVFFECITDVLPEFCPKLKELTLAFQGHTRIFFFNTWIPGISWLPAMRNLKELRIEIDCFFQTPDSIQQFGSSLPSMLPPNLEKIYLDATFSFAGLPGKMTSKRPEVLAYKEGIDEVISSLCRMPRLKVIAISTTHGTPSLWTRTGRRLLAGRDVKFKVLGGRNNRRMLEATWEDLAG